MPSATETFLLSRLRHHWTPPPVQSIEAWLHARLRLSRNQTTDYAGQPYDIALVPHVRLIFDFLRDPLARELSIMKSSAAQMSTACAAAATWMLWDDPGNLLYLIGNQEEAKKMSHLLFQPFFRQVFGDATVDQQDQSNLHLKINGVEIMLGSPTESFLRGKQFKYFFEDEADTLPETLLGGGQDLDTAEAERTKNTHGAKIIRLGTPLFKFNPTLDKRLAQPGTRTHRHYLRGDRREFRVTCPACRLTTPLRRADLVTDHCKNLLGHYDLDRVRDETFWQCPSCPHRIHDSTPEKRALMQSGVWTPTSKSVSSRVWSAHHTDLCSLVGTATWGNIMAAWHESEHDPARRTGLLRSHFAEPEDLTEASADRTKASILAHCGTHQRGTCPLIPWFIGIVADVQEDMSFFPWMTAAFDHLGNTTVIDCGEAEDFAELEHLYSRPIPLALPASLEPQRPKHADGTPVTHLYCQRAAIDSGHFAKGDESDPTAESVYRFCLSTWLPWENRFRWVPLKGRGQTQMATSLTEDRVARVNSTIHLPLHFLNDPAFKRILYLIRLSDPAHPHKDKPLHPRILLPRPDDFDAGQLQLQHGERFVTLDQLLSELTAERLMDRLKRIGKDQRLVREWYTPRSQPNNLGDTLKMLLALYTLAARHHQAPA